MSVRVRPTAQPAVVGRRAVRITVVGLGVGVFAFAGQTLWDQLGSLTALMVSLAFLALAVIDVVTAWTGLRRPVVHADAPDDVFTGASLELSLVVHGVSRACTLTVRSLRGAPPVRIVPVRGGAVDGVVTVSVPLRGLVRRVVVELEVTGLFGLFTVHRRLAVPLPTPVHVAPAPAGPVPDAPLRPHLRSEDGSEASYRFRSGQADPRGARPYVPGDPRRAVHWPATAREGVLMVREPDAPVAPPVVAVELRLDPDEPGNEAAVARCRALVEAAFAQGSPVRLTTSEARARSVPGVDRRAVSTRRRGAGAAGVVEVAEVVEVERDVAGPTDLHRRLARAEVGEVTGGGPGVAPRTDEAAPPLEHGSGRWCVRGSGEDGWR